MTFLNIDEINQTPFNLTDAVAPTSLPQPTPQITIASSSIRAGQRRLRTETSSFHSLKSACNELIDVLIKYGNNSDGIPALHAAIKAGDESAVRLLLDHGASPDAKAMPHNSAFEEPTTSLDYAAKYGQFNIAKLLIERGAKSEHEIRLAGGVLFKISSLTFAAQGNQPEIIKLLLAHGTKIVSYSPGSDLDLEFDPIYCAIRNGSLAALQTLINAGGRLDNAELAKSCDLMQVAVSSGNMEMIKFLLNHQFPVDGAYHWAGSALGAAIEKEDIPMIQLLISSGAKIHIPELGTNDPWSIGCRKDNLAIIDLLIKSSPINLNEKLFVAVEKGNLNTVKALVNAGADVNSRDKNTRKPLIFSAVRWPSILRILIDKGADINAPFDGGNTILHHSVWFGVPETISILVKSGGPINAINSMGKTALHEATGDHNGKPEMIQILLENGANVNLVSYQGWKPAQLAMRKLDVNLLKLFIKMGININEFDPSGATLLDSAIDNRNDSAISFFLINEAKATINHKSPKDGRTAFLRATERGNFEVMKLLLQKGAEINAKDKNGRTALTIANQYHQELVKWLIDNGAK